MSETPDIVDGQAFRTRLTTLLNGGHLRQAAQMFADMPLSLPRDPELIGWEAFVELRLGHHDRAVALARDALSLAPDQSVALLVLGAGLRRQGAQAEATEALLRAHRAVPENVEAACMLLEAAVEALAFDSAAAIYEEVAARSTDPAVRGSWAKLAFAKQRTERLPPGFGAATVASVKDWLAEQGSSPVFQGERERFRIEGPPIFGEPDLPREAMVAEGYEPYACTVPDATILSASSIIYAPDGTALNDTLADPRYGRFLALPHDKTVVARDDHRLLFDLNGHSLMELDRAVMLSGWASIHFGHWVPEYLCRLAYLERHPQFAEAPIVVDASMPVQHLEYLRQLVSNPIVTLPARHALRCRELLVGSPSTFFPVHLTPGALVPPEHQGGLPLGGFRFLQRKIREALPSTGQGGRKLYLSRRNCTWRRLLNDDEVGHMLAELGFEVLYPEDMSFEEQVRMYQSAAVVVAPNGSSLLNAIFAPTDVKLIVLSQRGLFNWGTFYGLMRDLGYDLAFLCGEGQPDKHSNYTIPLPRLLEALNA